MEQVAKNIWQFPIILPENPLKWLNCYVIKGERNLLIDTGFNREECKEALFEGMQKLDLRPENTDVFFTHLHSDHTGNAGALQDAGYRLFMSDVDIEYYSKNYFDTVRQRILSEGMPEYVMKEVFKKNPAVKYISKRFYPERLNDGDELNYGGYKLKCVLTPGHTPGHMCLYDEEHKLIFLGDHVLFDISPNVTAWPSMADSLGSYLESLQKIAEYEVELPLPAHRNFANVTMQARIAELIEHHRVRLDETERVIRENPGINAHDAAGKMKWRIRAKDWDDFPPGQKWFAVGEALSHLDYLVLRKRISREETEGKVTYSAE